MSDQLFPFLLNEAPIRGRVVRLNQSLQEIIAIDDYPPIIAQYLAEAVTIAALLTASLKEEGVFTLQIQSKGTLSMLVADAVFGGVIRGYADFDAERLSTLGRQPSLAALCPEGYIAITLDQPGRQRYQGIVPLEGRNIAEAMQRYFRQSQQLDVQLKVAVGSLTTLEGENLISGAIYIEKMPDQEMGDEDLWHEACALFETVRDDELLDDMLPLPDLLHRLFHERGVWVQEPLAMRMQCRCSRERFLQHIAGMGAAAIDEMAIDGVIEATCHFCKTTYRFTEQECKQTSIN